MTTIGHNSRMKDQLKSYVERIERLEEQKRTFVDDIRDVYKEAKDNSFDAKVLREVIRLRRMDAQERQDRETTRDAYLQALGMLADTPLGQAAIERAGASA